VDHRKNHIKVLGQLKIVESPRLGFGGVIAWAERCFWPLNLDFGAADARRPRRRGDRMREGARQSWRDQPVQDPMQASGRGGTSAVGPGKV
jgi:hypothetical protein